MEQLTADEYVHDLDSPAYIVCPDDDCGGRINLDLWQKEGELKCSWCEEKFELHIRRKQ